MGNEQLKVLAAPDLPDAVNGNLKRSDIQSAEVVIPVYDFMAVGDSVTLWVEPIPLKPGEPIIGAPIIPVTTVAPLKYPVNHSNLDVSTWKSINVHYSVRNKDNAVRDSEKVTVAVVD